MGVGIEMRQLSDMFSPEDLEQERLWTEQLRKTQQDLYDRVMEGMALANKQKERKALYQKWRGIYGDDLARQYAKCIEAIFEGKAKPGDYKKFNHRDRS